MATKLGAVMICVGLRVGNLEGDFEQLRKESTQAEPSFYMYYITKSSMKDLPS